MMVMVVVVVVVVVGFWKVVFLERRELAAEEWRARRLTPLASVFFSRLVIVPAEFYDTLSKLYDIISIYDMIHKQHSSSFAQHVY